MGNSILIIDSVPALARALENMLKTAGCELVCVKAYKSSEGLKSLEQEQQISMVICEWDMPEMPGPDLFNEAKSKGLLNGKRFFLTFKKKTREEILAASNAGVSGFLVRPVTLVLVQKIVST
ncbi:MAG: hypothetical protein A2268_12165 [Candidatus Raymondbacteria bacterium RifOxyA12_full_50_37]|uniref:Response regulatory domain-containing protein n=1 Tax=Candidatus Raymondbacteria bacterium RIFOXYD12_FULL_49_13 TaxID=1817890 RepID=A0A1F7F2W0_UNCRA|nr:MAG: hypothetical protein A2268_12165 [Candidatus Raymondbacteria bacterium RifOxyA12_full_50_37]OGJ90300.1 MAG: hypothetical protein A2248_00050 [Candidatus Raymondbacteria bacterium RIFOXYA2_FULL_49_16]OGJ97290.1 MAG: hypothetical protein A2453_01510 [Candidatus Raymondbacteria bacterium RIFOXYC2_FULL_50_21]OGK00903.1 MAG: hypothetical protein A2519_12680 [Candidatus Raymondbacteria bacterium RIFOXYD12_FULL_49_13]OGK02514.1 MAG: hypothetical protein A2350_09955 [Candidatus Raymondbacteria 